MKRRKIIRIVGGPILKHAGLAGSSFEQRSSLDFTLSQILPCDAWQKKCDAWQKKKELRCDGNVRRKKAKIIFGA